MAPKKCCSGMDEIEEIKKSLNFMSQDMSEIKGNQIMLKELMKEITHLRAQIEEKDKKITELENRMDGMEQYSKLNDVIVTGLKIKPRTYAQAVNQRRMEEPSEEDTSAIELQVANFLSTKGINLDVNSIEACHPLPRKNGNDTPAIILRFWNRKKRDELMKQGKRLIGTNVYLNDHLTKKNANIAKKARYLRKQNKIQRTWVRNCKVYIKLNGSPEEAKVIVVKDIEELGKYE